MGYVWSWLAAMVAHFVAGAGVAFAMDRLVLVGPSAIYSGWIVVLSVLSVLVVQAVAAAAGAAAHRSEQRDHLGHDAVAALGVPLVWLLSRLITDAQEPGVAPLALVLTVVVGVSGALGGWFLVRLLRRRAARRAGVAGTAETTPATPSETVTEETGAPTVDTTEPATLEGAAEADPVERPEPAAGEGATVPAAEAREGDDRA